MSRKAVPVCTNCGRSSEVSISCTNCYLICCVTCLNLRSDIFDAIAKGADALIRRCPKCLDAETISIAIKAEPCETKPTTTSVGPSKDRNLCKLHRKECKLYCTQCQAIICGRCIDEDQPHELHHIDNFSIVYREKVLQLNSKLDQAMELFFSLNECSDVWDWNLKLLEKEEDAMLQEIDALSESSKFKVTRLTSIRKERLRAQLQLPVERDRTVKQIRDKVRNHSADDLMANLSELDQICTTLATTPPASDISLEPVDDIECDLIPAYNFTQITVEGLLQNDNCSFGDFLLPSSHDTLWYLQIMATEDVQLLFTPSDPELLKFPHKVVAIIPQADTRIEIRRTFDLKDNQTTFDLVPMYRLGTRFNNKDAGDLEMKIGIRPANAVVEKQLLTYQYEQVKTRSRSTELDLENSESKLKSITGRVDYNHFCMYYKLKEDILYKGFVKSSLHIIDDSDRRWRLNMYFHNCVGVYIELLTGTATYCNYFIELRNADPDLTILKSASNVYMDVGDEEGWDCFIEWNDLIDDDDFFPDGSLRFRFGVCPLSN